MITTPLAVQALRWTRLALATITLATTFVAPASSTTITVNTLDGSGAADGLCSLSEAMQAANTDAAFGDCPAGNGWDRISFSITGTITPTNDLPAVQQSLSIVGPGAALLIIDGLDTVRLLDLGAIDGLESFLVSGLTLTRGISPGFGGAIRVAQRNWLTLVECRITGNVAAGGGGGISFDNNASSDPLWTSLLIERSEISNNTTDSPAGGGGLRIGFRNHATVVDSTVSNNSLTHVNAGGGGVLAFLSNGGSLTVLRSTVSGNSALDLGGGVEFIGTTGDQALLSIGHSTIVSNAGSSGGGLWAQNAAFFIANSLIADNAATGLDPDIGFGPDVNVVGVSPSLIEDNGTLTLEFPSGSPNANGDYVGLDPDLGALTDNGGPTWTHMPSSTSNAVDNGACPAESADQRDFSGSSGRTEGAGCDIGAVERGAGSRDPIFASNFESGSTHRWTTTIF